MVGSSGPTVPCLRKARKMAVSALRVFLLYNELIKIRAIQPASDVMINVTDISLAI